MIKARRLGRRPGNDVERARHRIGTGAGDVEVGDLVESVDIVERYGFQVVESVFVLVNLLLELLEYFRAVQPLRLDEVVLRIQKDFPVCLPDAVALHPLPLVPRVVFGWVGDDPDRVLGSGPFQTHAAALDEVLHGCIRLHRARGDLARTHLHVYEEVVEQRVTVAVDQGARVVALRGQVRIGARASGR